MAPKRGNHKQNVNRNTARIHGNMKRNACQVFIKIFFLPPRRQPRPAPAFLGPRGPTRDFFFLLPQQHVYYPTAYQSTSSLQYAADAGVQYFARYDFLKFTKICTMAGLFFYFLIFIIFTPKNIEHPVQRSKLPSNTVNNQQEGLTITSWASLSSSSLCRIATGHAAQGGRTWLQSPTAAGR